MRAIRKTTRNKNKVDDEYKIRIDKATIPELEAMIIKFQEKVDKLERGKVINGGLGLLPGSYTEQSHKMNRILQMKAQIEKLQNA